jgi:hypothetical protein
MIDVDNDGSGLISFNEFKRVAHLSEHSCSDSDESTEFTLTFVPKARLTKQRVDKNIKVKLYDADVPLE